MEFQDKMLQCIECGREFVFTAGEQLFYYDKQFKHEPKRCRACKRKRVPEFRAAPENRDSGRVETQAICSQCGKETTVPFKPTQGRPILCRPCFLNRRKEASA